MCRPNHTCFPTQGVIHDELGDDTFMNGVLYFFHHFSSFPGGFTSQPGSRLCFSLHQLESLYLVHPSLDGLSKTVWKICC